MFLLCPSAFLLLVLLFIPPTHVTCVPHLMTWMLRQAVSGVFRISLSSSSSFFLPLPLTHTFAPGTHLTATGCRMSVCELPPHLVPLSLCLSFVMLKRAFYVGLGLVSRVTGCECFPCCLALLFVEVCVFSLWRACVMLSGVFGRWWTGVTGDDWRGRQAVSDFPAALRCCLWKCVFSLWRACVRDAESCCRWVADWRDG